MADPPLASIDRHLAAEVRSVLEQRFWRPVEDGSTVEALRDADELGPAGEHPMLFADHGIVHVRDIAAGVVDLGGDGRGSPPAPPAGRPARLRGRARGDPHLRARRRDARPDARGRRIHALYAAHVPFPGEMDDVLDRLVDDAGPVVRRVDAVNAVAPFRVAPDLVLRELVSLAAAHSKSVFPAALLADCPGLRRRMRDVLLTDLDEHRRAGPAAAPDDAPARAAGANARWYSDPAGDAYAWLDSPEAAHRALVDDAIDAVRLVRAAECASAAPRCAPRRGTRSSSTPSPARRCSRCAPPATTTSCSCVPTARSAPARRISGARS